MYDGTELKMTETTQAFIYHVVSHVRIDPEASTKDQIQETVITDGERPEGFMAFSCMIPLGVLHNDRGQQKQFHGQVFIDAVDISDAFDKLRGAIDNARPKLQQDIKNQIARMKIQLPGQALIEKLNRNGQGFSLGDPG